MGTVELLSKLQELKAIRAEREALEAQENALIDEIKAEMSARGVDSIRVGIHKAVWSKFTTRRFDTKAFRNEHKDLYDEFLVETPSSRFSLM